MAYLGSEPTTGVGSTTKQQFSGDASTVAFTMLRAAALSTDLEVFVDNVQQEPTVAYECIWNNSNLYRCPSNWNE